MSITKEQCDLITSTSPTTKHDSTTRLTFLDSAKCFLGLLPALILLATKPYTGHLTYLEINRIFHMIEYWVFPYNNRDTGPVFDWRASLARTGSIHRVLVTLQLSSLVFILRYSEQFLVQSWSHAGVPESWAIIAYVISAFPVIVIWAAYCGIMNPAYIYCERPWSGKTKTEYPWNRSVNNAFVIAFFENEISFSAVCTLTVILVRMSIGIICSETYSVMLTHCATMLLWLPLLMSLGLMRALQRTTATRAAPLIRRWSDEREIALAIAATTETNLPLRHRVPFCFRLLWISFYAMVPSWGVCLNLVLYNFFMGSTPGLPDLLPTRTHVVAAVRRMVGS